MWHVAWTVWIQTPPDTRLCCRITMLCSTLATCRRHSPRKSPSRTTSKLAIARYSPNSIWLVTSRLDTTRYLAHSFWHGKSRDETCRDVSRLSDSTTRHARHDERDRCDSHDTCSWASPQRGLGWTCPTHFFQKLFLRLMQIQSTKD